MTEDDCIASCHSNSDSGTTDGARSEDESGSEFIFDHRTTDATEEHRTTDTPRRDLTPCIPEGLEDGESFSTFQITDTPNRDPEPCPEQTRQETRGTAEALGNGLSTYFCMINADVTPSRYNRTCNRNSPAAGLSQPDGIHNRSAAHKTWPHTAHEGYGGSDSMYLWQSRGKRVKKQQCGSPMWV